MAKDLFDVVPSDTVRIYRTYTLRDAAQAHRELESCKTAGSVVLTL
jgi:NADPH:quinone reductase-like Zn-dependent oxidoreductase